MRRSLPPGFTAVLIGGITLAATAGYVNTIMILANGYTVTHVTGAISTATADLQKHHFAHASHVIAIVLSFAAGAAVAGLFLGSQHLVLGRRYGGCLVLVAVLLAISAFTLTRVPTLSTLTAAAAAGLQNALATTYNGLIVRTTHVTGILTDFGFLIGRWLRGTPLEFRKLSLLAGLILAFASGGATGAYVFAFAGNVAMAAPAVVIGLMGSGYWIWRTRIFEPYRRTLDV